MKTYEKGILIEQNRLSEGIYDMHIQTDIAKYAAPGQFAMVYPYGKDILLPRPISICEVNGSEIRLVYRTVGRGTTEFSEYKAGTEVKLLGPLGNGFPTDKAEGNVVLMGGGIGVPPILGLFRALSGKSVTTVLGYRNSDLFLKEDFDKYGRVEIATEDGSTGVKGNVMDALAKLDIPCDTIYACGPMPMLRAIKKYAAEHGIKAYISLEERMACGVGACLGCVCKTVKKDEHSHVENARVCTEGPVFEAGEVDI